MEFGEHFKAIMDFLSVDDKAKIKIGIPAVSRYHQLARFLLIWDVLAYKNHDYPEHGNLLTPSGYLIMQFLDSSMEVDTFGRECTKLSRSGALKIINHAFKFHSSKAQSHMSGIFELHEIRLHENFKPGIVILSDGGWDYNCKSEIMFLSLHHFFEG